MTIGTHLASLNLFREEDGSLWITTSGFSHDLLTEYRESGERRPMIEYVMSLIIEAAGDIEARRAAGLASPDTGAPV